jgi:hypothetical protein
MKELLDLNTEKENIETEYLQSIPIDNSNAAAMSLVMNQFMSSKDYVDIFVFR